ncbi:MAG TPA: hypothetical protein VKN18_07960 [Blastocatellia bacterium]|nr:hypothetical protein [Blastocatellia bacterium]
MRIRHFSDPIRKTVTAISSILLLLSSGGVTSYFDVIGTDFDVIGTVILAQAEAPDLNHIIAEFTSRESEARAAFDNYGYTRYLVTKSIKDGKITGEYRQTTEVGLGKSGKLEERVLSFPKPSLTELVVTPEDLEDLSANCIFPLESANASKYKFSYVGKERLEEVETYVFNVEPKASPSRECLYTGQIWVRVSDLRIVRMLGRSVRKTNQKFPMLDRRRVAVRDQFMFPSHATADEELVFPKATVHMQMEVQYFGYVKLRN